MSLYFIGNSHLDQFKLETCPRVVKIAYVGASIKGLTNPNSKLKLNTHIQTIIQSDPSPQLVFCLGQVDIEFGYYYKCVIDQKKYDIMEYIDDLIIKYEVYLKTLPCKVHICCINPTVITHMEHIFKVCFTEDNGKEGGYSGITSNLTFNEIKLQYLNDSFEIRWNMNVKFNEMLENMCKKNNYNYINYWPVLMNKDGTLQDKYKPIGIDHHLNDCNSIELRDYVLNKISRHSS
jgi:hypothetical protein